MKRNKIISSIVLTTLLALTACTNKVVDNPIVISAAIGKAGETLNNTERLFQLGDTLIYKFEVTSPNGISKIEFSNYEGVGVNMKAPVVLSKIENISGITWTLIDTIKDIQNDIRFSVYVEDENRQYKTLQINAYLDVSSYFSETLYDGLSNGTSKTFLNVESGRTYYVANTIGDPTGIDIGFTYMENQSQVLGSFVSFDEYWNTGNYSTIVNDLNQPVTFRKSISATSSSSSWIRDKKLSATELKTLYDTAAEFPSVSPLFPDGKIAPNLGPRDVVSFKTADGRYGLIQVILVDKKNGSALNTQKVSFAMVVEKKLK